jgi:pimeloyl-ACP methyl ester carboxylesterase
MSQSDSADDVGQAVASEASEEEAAFARYPRAELPSRRYRIDSHGVAIAVCEWGDADARPLLLAHGGFDFAHTFCVFAPLLAAAGYRVVSWDQRGHGDSQHTILYSWEADMRDGLAVLDTISREPAPFVGHSKGGSLLTQLALACPHRVSHLVNIDGMPSRSAQPDVPNRERTRLKARDLSSLLDHRRSAFGRQRPSGSVEELARRRARMNPRLSHEWLCFLVTQGAQKHAEGWRWKIDPALRFGGFGPWRPHWTLERLPGLAPPLLGLLCGRREPMGFDSHIEDLTPFLPTESRIETFEDSGHFIHIEEPDACAARVLEFLGS